MNTIPNECPGALVLNPDDSSAAAFTGTLALAGHALYVLGQKHD